MYRVKNALTPVHLNDCYTLLLKTIISLSSAMVQSIALDFNHTPHSSQYLYIFIIMVQSRVTAFLLQNALTLSFWQRIYFQEWGWINSETFEYGFFDFKKILNTISQLNEIRCNICSFSSGPALPPFLLIEKSVKMLRRSYHCIK